MSGKMYLLRTNIFVVLVWMGWKGPENSSLYSEHNAISFSIFEILKERIFLSSSITNVAKTIHGRSEQRQHWGYSCYYLIWALGQCDSYQFEWSSGATRHDSFFMNIVIRWQGSLTQILPLHVFVYASLDRQIGFLGWASRGNVLRKICPNNLRFTAQVEGGVLSLVGHGGGLQ